MVFRRKEAKPKSGDITVAASQGAVVKKGEIGIEVEVEASRANSVPKENFGYWLYTQDGSLRGADNGEFLLAKPISFDEADKALDELWAKFTAAKTPLIASNRTSVHVHMNVGPFYQNRLVSLLALWFIHEEILSHWCGETRVGNLFCIRAKDGPAVITDLKRYIENEGSWRLNTERLHYAAMNVSAIHKQCSVEARTLRGCTEPETIKQWCRILRKLYDGSDRYADPRSIVETFSLEGPLDFFRLTFGEEAEGILRGTSFTEDQLRMSLFEGMRYAQELVFSRDWSNFNPVKSVVDPFGRKTKKSSLDTYIAVAQAADPPHALQPWNAAPEGLPYIEQN